MESQTARSDSSRPPYASVALALLFATLPVGSAAPAVAGEWSQYRGPSRDGQATMFEVPEVWPETLAEVWKVEVGEGIASPVVSGGRIYLITRQGDDEVVMALGLADGKTLWTKHYPTPYTAHQAAVRFGQGPRSTPVVAEGTVCALGVDAHFSCHDAESGKELWARDFSEKSAPTKTFCGSSISPLIHDGVVFIHLGDDLAGRFFAAELRTGKELWGWEGQGPGYASPLMLDIEGQRQLVTFATTDLLSFDPKSGELLWNRPYPDKWRENIVTPLVVGERIVISDFENGTLSLWPEKTAEGWKVEDHWHNEELTQRMASPVTDGEVIFGFSDRRKGQLFVLDPASGKVLWEDEGRGGDNAVLAMAGGFVLITGTDASLRVMRWDGETLDEVKRYELADSAVWAEPGWLGNGLLVKDTRHLKRLALVRPPSTAETASSQ